MARSYVTSLLFMFECGTDHVTAKEKDATANWHGDGGIAFGPDGLLAHAGPEMTRAQATRAAQLTLLNHGLRRLEAACGGAFAPEPSLPGGAPTAGAAATANAGATGDAPAPAGAAPAAASGALRKGPPNLIRGWTDDAYLSSIVRSTPLVVSTAALVSGLATQAAFRVWGWSRGASHAPSGIECWVLRRSRPKSDEASKIKPEPPLVMIPGAGNGLLSFLPLAFMLQRKLPSRDLVIFRLPHVEVGRPWTKLPQWSAIVEGILLSLKQLEIRDCDLVAHSYGSAVANRLLRELCLDRRFSDNSNGAKTSSRRSTRSSSSNNGGNGNGKTRSSRTGSSLNGESHEDSGSPSPHTSGVVIGFLGLVDPITLGGASCGLVGVINEQGPDLSFAFCANRAGVTHKEILDFDPALYGQCRGRVGSDGASKNATTSSTTTTSASTGMAPLPSGGTGRGIGVYISEGDVLLDVALTKHILTRSVPHAHLEVDPTPHSFHGRWLVELWAGGNVLWSPPCSQRCLGLLFRGLAGKPLGFKVA